MTIIGFVHILWSVSIIVLGFVIIHQRSEIAALKKRVDLCEKLLYFGQPDDTPKWEDQVMNP